MTGAVKQLRELVPDGLEACEEAVAYLEAGGFETLQAAYEVCECGPWLGWLLDRLRLAKREDWARFYAAIESSWNTYIQTRVTDRAQMDAAIRAYEKAEADVWRELIPQLPPQFGGKEAA